LLKKNKEKNVLKYLFRLFAVSFFFASSLSSYQTNLAIGMIFKNEAPYLKEWIEYHRLVGVEHFYLYNDGSSDNFREVLKPYIKQGIVTLSDAITQADFNGTQVDCYNRTLIHTYGKCKWVAMLDSDEFLVTPKKIKILDVLNRFEGYGAVTINWRCFGTSNVVKIPSDKLMIECLTRCASNTHPMNNMVKSIVRPECVRCFGGPHWPEFVPGFFAVDTDGKQYTPPNPLCKMNKLWINHYWTRDEDFLINVKVPRGIPWGRPPEGVYAVASELNLEEDTTILRHVPKLRKKIFSDKIERK
jgi:hypothetical protein